MGWVCWFAAKFLEVFSWVLRLFPLQKPTFDLICVNSVWLVSPISKTHVPGYKKWDFDKVTIIIFVVIIIIIIIIIIRSHCPQMSEIDSNLVLPSFSTSNC